MKLIALFIKRIIYFLLFIVFFYLIGIIAYGEFVPKYLHQNIFYEKFAYGFSNTRFKEVKTKSDVDIVFLGSSRSYRHYDPRIFSDKGFTSFNLGSSAQTFLQTEILVNRYLESLNPDYVVLDIYPSMFSSEGIESTFDLISNDYNDFDTLELALRLKNIKVLNTWIYAFYQETFKNSLKDIEEKSQGENTYLENGFVHREIEVNSKSERAQKVEWEFNDLQWAAFIRIIKKVNDIGAELYLIHSPRKKNFEYNKPKRLKSFLELQNLKFYNFKDLNFISDSLHFYDPSHLNQNGINLYNDYLLETIFQNKNSPSIK